jgi:hypothetical protein
MSTFSPSPRCLHFNGERVGVRGGGLFCACCRPSPYPLPVKDGERVLQQTYISIAHQNHNVTSQKLRHARFQ